LPALASTSLELVLEFGSERAWLSATVAWQ
jgi:hypothetical protein